MARYRIGNSYLSEEEYNQHTEWQFGLILFAIGAALLGYVCYKYALPHIPPEYPKWSKVAALVVSGAFGGSILFYFRKSLMLVLGLCILLGIAYLTYYVLERLV